MQLFGFLQLLSHFFSSFGKLRSHFFELLQRFIVIFSLTTLAYRIGSTYKGAHVGLNISTKMITEVGAYFIDKASTALSTRR